MIRSTRSVVSNAVRDFIGGKVRRRQTRQVVDQGEAKEEFDDDEDDDEVEDPDEGMR